MKYLAVDPSGTGTTGLYFYDSEKRKELFSNFQSKEWVEHFQFIKNFCQEYQVNILVCEITNYVKFLGVDLVSLLKLLGAVEALPYFLADLDKIKKIYTREIKILHQKVLAKSLKIPRLTFKIGRGGGWFRKEQKISVHELDAFLIFYYYRKKKKSLIED